MIPRFSLGVFSSLLNKKTKNKREKKASIYAMHLNVSRYGAPHKKVDAFSQTNKCYTSKLVSKQSKCPGYFSKTEYLCGAGRLKSVQGGTTQMWGASTQDHVGRIDFGADRPAYMYVV